jgi:hypothetical protein
MLNLQADYLGRRRCTDSPWIREEGVASPAALNRKKLTLLIVASQLVTEKGATFPILRVTRVQ